MTQYAGKFKYKYVFGLLGSKSRAPEANSAVFSHCYDGAITGGVDADDGNAVTQRLRRCRQSKSHLPAASCTLLPLFVLLKKVCAELSLHHINVC